MNQLNQTCDFTSSGAASNLFYWTPATDPHRIRQGKHGEWRLVGFGFSDGQGWHLNQGRSADRLGRWRLNMLKHWVNHLTMKSPWFSDQSKELPLFQLFQIGELMWIITIQPLELSKIGRQNGLWVVESSSELQLRYSCRSRVWPQSNQSNGWCQNIYELCLSNFYGLARAHTISYPVSCRPPLRNHFFLRGE